MWFVWDGLASHGPFSEKEICERILSGQWPLTVFVRPQASSIYRPFIWVLPQWSQALSHSSQTVVRAASPMHEQTQVAQRTDAVQFDFLTSDLIGPKSLRESDHKKQVLNQPTPRNEAPAQNDQTKLIVQRVADSALSGGFAEKEKRPENERRHLADAIAEGQRLTWAYEKLKSSSRGDVQGTSQAINRPKQVATSARPAKRGVLQSAMLASEGSVSLIDSQSSTQVRLRRVNPTAPRRRARLPKSHFQRLLKSPLLAAIFQKRVNLGLLSISLLGIFMTLIALSALVVMLFVYTSKNQKTKMLSLNSEILQGGFERTPVQTDQAEQVLNVPIENSESEKKQKKLMSKERKVAEKKRTAAAVDRFEKKRKTQQKEKNVLLNARPIVVTPQQRQTAPVTAKSQTNDGKKIIANAGELRRILEQPDAREFVVVGPIKLQSRPGKRCSPCRGNGVLSDGTILNLSSVFEKPWKTVERSERVFVRGILIGSQGFTMTINSMSQNPP